MKRIRPKGQSLVEFTLVCIPLIFILIGIFELSRFMWCYHTLAFAVERGARFAVVHGSSSSTSVSAVAETIRTAASGLDPAQMTVALQASSSTQNCSPLRNCEQVTSQWPDASSNTAGQSVTVAAVYPFHTPLRMFWPGVGSVNFGVITMSATATEEIRF